MTLQEFDERLSQQLAVCATQDSRFGILRPLVIFLEFTGHGLLWLPLVAFEMLLAKDLQLQVLLTNLMSGLGLDLLVVGTTKMLFRRPRPPVNQDDMLATVSVDRFSFPSGHCTRAAMICLFLLFTPLLDILQLRWVYTNFVIITWAVILCISRAVLGRHYPSDCLAGALIGCAQYKLVTLLWIPDEYCRLVCGYMQLVLKLGR